MQSQMKKRILLDESIVGRYVNTDLNEEYFDTRIKPNGTLMVQFDYKPKNKIQEFLWEIEVNPDEQYVRSFEEQLVTKADIISKQAIQMLQESLSEKRTPVIYYLL